jgi:hypothetical protein
VDSGQNQETLAPSSTRVIVWASRYLVLWGGVTWPISDRLPRCRLDTRRMLDLYSPLTKLSVVFHRFCDIATPSS